MHEKSPPRRLSGDPKNKFFAPSPLPSPPVVERELGRAAVAQPAKGDFWGDGEQH